MTQTIRVNILRGMIQDTDDLRIQSLQPLLSPAILQQEIAMTEKASETVAQARKEAQAIISGEDDRCLVIAGPCSIHDTKAAREYATHLIGARHLYKEDLCILMRVYFEKPRTTVGWKGLINDPDINHSFHINKGLDKPGSCFVISAIGGFRRLRSSWTPSYPNLSQT